MKLTLSFSWVGLVLFALPMVINIFYAIFPPAETDTPVKNVTRWVEIVEKVSRITFLVLLTFLVSKAPLSFRSVWLMLAGVFLILYYIVWVRYFVGGRNIALLSKPFLFVPIPLAVFPVLYYLFAAVWTANLPAAVTMLIFGAAHITVTRQLFR